MSGVVLGAAYLLWTIQRAFLGPKNEKYADLPDINFREVASLLPLAIIVIFLGVYPMPLIDLIDSSLIALNDHIKPFLEVAQTVAGK